MPVPDVPFAAAPPPARRVVAAFDFDGTLTRRDTLLPFLVRAFGRAHVARALAGAALDSLRRLPARPTANRFKVHVLARLFPGAPVQALRELGALHAQGLHAQLRPRALERMRWHRRQGHELVLVSATLELYLLPLGQALGFDQVLCTRLATRGAGADAVFDGRLMGADCSAAEKPRRLAEHLGDLSTVELHAYGDSADDAPLLALAAQRHFRPFR